jgi:hypothetical protein
MTGYPSVSPNGGSGVGGSSSVVATVTPIPPDGSGVTGAPPEQVTIDTGSTAVFFLAWVVTGASCQVANGFAFSPPSTAPIYTIVNFSFRFCNRAIMESVVLPAGAHA